MKGRHPECFHGPDALAGNSNGAKVRNGNEQHVALFFMVALGPLDLLRTVTLPLGGICLDMQQVL